MNSSGVYLIMCARPHGCLPTQALLNSPPLPSPPLPPALASTSTPPQAYLTRKFFDLVYERMADLILLVVATSAEGEVVAGAWNLVGSRALFGRNWGSLENYRHLHFEACYYQAIDEAIERGLDRVEAGAQGQETKLARGYAPSRTFSSHYIRDAPFRGAVGAFLASEAGAVEDAVAQLTAAGPFKAARDACGGEGLVGPEAGIFPLAGKDGEALAEESG